jgi:hypothetical protein
MVGDIISERWAELSRNGGRHHSGIVGDIDRNPPPRCHQLRSWHFELFGRLLDGGLFVDRLDLANPDGFVGRAVDAATDWLRRFGLLCHAGSLNGRLIAFNRGVRSLQLPGKADKQSPGPLWSCNLERGPGLREALWQASRCNLTPATAAAFRVLHRGHAARLIVKRVEKPTDNKTT